jgi:hypothetical protein
MTQKRETFRVADRIELELRLFQPDTADTIRGLDYPDAGEDTLLYCSIAIADACFPYSRQEEARQAGLHDTTISRMLQKR